MEIFVYIYMSYCKHFICMKSVAKMREYILECQLFNVYFFFTKLLISKVVKIILLIIGILILVVNIYVTQNNSSETSDSAKTETTLPSATTNYISEII
jgi:hypothetical protein